MEKRNASIVKRKPNMKANVIVKTNFMRRTHKRNCGAVVLGVTADIHNPSTLEAAAGGSRI